MAVLLTGATGSIGSYVLARLLSGDDGPVRALVRGTDGEARLTRALSFHLGSDRIRRVLDEGRLTVVPGDLTRDGLGLDDDARDHLVRDVSSVIHCAATLNRRSERACVQVNLKGFLEVLLLARAAHERGGLRRFTHVSTVAVAGRRQDELVKEDEAIDWGRSDYDPYARTKKFGEQMLARLLPGVSTVVVRPSIVMGDSTRPETDSFEMVRAFAFLARLWVLPLRAHDRIDIVPHDWVADAIVALHRADAPSHARYHLSAGAASPTCAAITGALAKELGRRRPWFAPWLGPLFSGGARAGASLGHGTGFGRACARMAVFMPYLTWNTVFDNARAVDALGRPPASFLDYCAPLLRWSREHGFRRPDRETPR